MPCTQTGSLEGDRALAFEEDYEEVAAMLCGILTVLDKRSGRLEGVLAQFDSKEAGVSAVRVKSWWKRHKAEDVERKKEEAAKKLAGRRR